MRRLTAEKRPGGAEIAEYHSTSMEDFFSGPLRSFSVFSAVKRVKGESFL